MLTVQDTCIFNSVSGRIMVNKTVYSMFVFCTVCYGTSSHQLFFGPWGPRPPPSCDQATWWDESRNFGLVCGLYTERWSYAIG